jgi:hypothetical protein
MRQLCERCGAGFDDETQATLCPHEDFDAERNKG